MTDVLIESKKGDSVSKKPSTRLAYIYSRVSTAMQVKNGEGISRQIDRGVSFIEQLNADNTRQGKHTYQVADELISDQGLSAYCGRNTAENAGLGAFLEAARVGNIPPHSLLVVEAGQDHERFLNKIDQFDDQGWL